MEERSLLIKFLGENPSFKIVDFLTENKGTDMSKKQIIEGAGISRASLFNNWAQLEEQGIVRVTRKFGKTKLYTLNSKSPIVKKLLELESVLISRALDKHYKPELVEACA
jgi:predicted transcriptional regulator